MTIYKKYMIIRSYKFFVLFFWGRKTKNNQNNLNGETAAVSFTLKPMEQLLHGKL